MKPSWPSGPQRRMKINIGYSLFGYLRIANSKKETLLPIDWRSYFSGEPS